MKKILLSIIMSLALMSVSYAGSFGVGVSGSIAHVSADGKETTTAGDIDGGTANINNASVDSLGGLATIFVDYEMDNGMAFGLEIVPASADVSDKTHQRTETAQGKSGTDADGSVTRKADAEVENFTTLYVEYPLGAAYVKAGWSQIDVNTKEAQVTDSGTYGNTTLDGYTIGLGIRGELGGFFTRTTLEYTDFEDLSLTSSTSNKIEADLDVTQLKFAIGKRF
jgi:hypothetical protein